MEAQLDPRGPPLGRRLRAIAERVPPGSRLADVGTDHALLPAWLVAQGRVARAIGMDIAQGPLQQAEITLERAELDAVELRCGDGLTPLSPGEVDTVTIAGMGGARITRLIDAAPQVVTELDRLIVQPNTDWPAVRRFIAQKHWGLRHESMVLDRGKFYVVFDIDPRSDDPYVGTDRDHQLGPQLLASRPPVFIDWIEHELARVHRALRRAAQGQTSAGPTPDPGTAALHARCQLLSSALIET